MLPLYLVFVRTLHWAQIPERSDYVVHGTTTANNSQSFFLWPVTLPRQPPQQRSAPRPWPRAFPLKPVFNVGWAGDLDDRGQAWMLISLCSANRWVGQGFGHFVGLKVMLFSTVCVSLAQNPMELLKPEREHIRNFPPLLPTHFPLPSLPPSFFPAEYALWRCTMLDAGQATGDCDRKDLPHESKKDSGAHSSKLPFADNFSFVDSSLKCTCIQFWEPMYKANLVFMFFLLMMISNIRAFPR